MKKTNLIFTIIAFFFLAALVSAEVSQLNKGFYSIIKDDGSSERTTTQVSNFDVIGFICANDDCSQVNGTLWNGAVLNSGNDNEITLVYPTTLQQKGYGLFFFKEGYFPYEVKADWNGNGQASNAERFLSKKENCQIPINDLVISHYGNKIVVNVTLSSDVSSPVSHAGPLNYVPDSIKHLYAVDAEVEFSFIGPQSISLKEEVNLPASENRRVSVYVENLKAGEYQLAVKSNSNDEKCVNSIPLIVHSNLLIEDNRTNVTLPTISIVSPEAKVYTQKRILVELRSTNATKVLYNWNGANLTYLSPVYVDFNEGVNTLTAYAINDVTTAITSVTFYVRLDNGTENNDTIPPGQVTNLHLVSKGKNFINWAWTNPTDVDFKESIIYVNGVKTSSTSNNFFNLSGLNEDSVYTITINTLDFSNNVNLNNVSNTQRTEKSGSDNDDNDDKSKSSSSKKRIILDEEIDEETKSPLIYPRESFEEEEEIKKKNNFNSTLLWIMLAIGSILLIILIILTLLLKK